MKRLALTGLACALALGAGCGGGGTDQEKAERTVREFVKATNDRDTGKLCGNLVTQEYLQETTLAPEDKAREACKRQFAQLKSPELRLLDVQRTEIDGDTAKVTTVVEFQGQRSSRVFRLKKDGGEWRLAGGSE